MERIPVQIEEIEGALSSLDSEIKILRTKVKEVMENSQEEICVEQIKIDGLILKLNDQRHSLEVFKGHLEEIFLKLKQFDVVSKDFLEHLNPDEKI